MWMGGSACGRVDVRACVHACTHARTRRVIDTHRNLRSYDDMVLLLNYDGGDPDSDSSRLQFRKGSRTKLELLKWKTHSTIWDERYRTLDPATLDLSGIDAAWNQKDGPARLRPSRSVLCCCAAAV